MPETFEELEALLARRSPDEPEYGSDAYNELAEHFDEIDEGERLELASDYRDMYYGEHEYVRDLERLVVLAAWLLGSPPAHASSIVLTQSIIKENARRILNRRRRIVE